MKNPEFIPVNMTGGNMTTPSTEDTSGDGGGGDVDDDGN
jgi:hypothetical protein